MASEMLGMLPPRLVKQNVKEQIRYLEDPLFWKMCTKTIQESLALFEKNGIPGYIFGMLVPDSRTIRKMPAALAHECNHNVRFQYVEWSNDISLGEMMIIEGLAENFAVHLYGKENMGP